jgi:hypothetical protein
LARIFDASFILRVMPTTAVFMTCALRFLWKDTGLVPWRWPLTALLVAIVLGPLLMHAIAWDTSRIWTYPILVAFLVTFFVSRMGVGNQASASAQPWFRPALLATLGLNAFLRIPLVDTDVVERFSFSARLLLYGVPVVAYLAVTFGRSRPAVPVSSNVHTG